MEMTKERLEAYRSNKGYPMPQSVVGFDQKKYERLQDRDIQRKERLEKECEEIEQFVDGIPDSLTHRIFRKYYIDGRQNVRLEDIAKKVHMTRSGVGKKIDRFLKVSRHSPDSHVQ